MADKLNDDQEKRIAATLRRIRAGLARAADDPFSEPAHIFKPEAYHDKTD